MSDSEFDAQSRARELVKQFRRNTNNLITDKNFEDLANSIAQALTAAASPQGSWPSEEELNCWADNYFEEWKIWPGVMDTWIYLSRFARPARATITDEEIEAAACAELERIRGIPFTHGHYNDTMYGRELRLFEAGVRWHRAALGQLRGGT